MLYVKIKNQLIVYSLALSANCQARNSIPSMVDSIDLSGYSTAEIETHRKKFFIYNNMEPSPEICTGINSNFTPSLKTHHYWYNFSK